VRTNFFEELINANNGAQVHLLEASFQESPDAKVQVQNALMASPPRHPFWKHVFESMKLGHNSHRWNDLHGTGPRMLSNLASEHLSDVHLLPCANFQRVGRCGNFRELELQKGIHWNQASWAPKAGHKWHTHFIHKGFAQAHPDLGDVALQFTQVALPFL
jgi:mannosyltransferase OCH1-like enzyme